MNTVIRRSSLVLAGTLASLSVLTGVQAQVKISQVYGGASGTSGTLNPDGDFVELFNAGSTPINMTGWSLRSAVSHTSSTWGQANIPAGTVIGAGQYYVVRFSRESSGGFRQSYQEDLAVLSGTGISDFVSTNSGKIVLMRSQTISLSGVNCPPTDATAGPAIEDYFTYRSSTSATPVCNESGGTIYTVPSFPSPTPGFGNNVSLQRKTSGCLDTNNNSSDFTAAAVVYRSNPPAIVSASASPAGVSVAGGSITISAQALAGATRSLCAGGSVTPALSGQSFTANLSAIGGGSSVALTGTDLNPFTLSYSVPSGLSVGTKTITISYQDASGNAVARDVSFNVFSALPTLTQDFGTLSNCTVTSSIPNSTSVQWYRFTLAQGVSPANNNYLDIDTETTGTSLANDTYLALYDAAGNLAAFDNDDGTDLRSALSFGVNSPTRAAPGNGVAYNGRDGSLAAGTYYLASTNSTFDLTNFIFTSASPLFVINSPNTTAINLVTNIRLGTYSLPGGLPGSFNDMGTLASNNTFASASATLSAAGDVKWFKFNLASGIDGTVRTYLDLDTETSVVSDTAMFLFNSSGALAGSDDNSGSGALSQLSFGFASPRTGGSGDALAYNGRSGLTLAGGDYYVAITGGGATASSTNWAVASCSSLTGSVTLRVRTGFIPVPPPPASAIDLGTLTNGVFIDSTFTLSAGGVQWFKFTIPAPGVDSSLRTFLDMDTEGTTGITATGIGLYRNPQATIQLSDSADGTGSLSQLTFGFPNITGNTARPAPGDGNPYDGRDGATLAAGTYYVVVGAQTMSYGPDWGATSTGTGSSSNVHFRVRFGTQPPPAPPALSADLGVLRALPDSANPGQFIACDKNTGPLSIAGTSGASVVKWVKFTTRSATSDTQYVDLVTDLSSFTGGIGPNDSEMGLYNSVGVRQFYNDDWAGGGVPLSGLSFGGTTIAARTYGAFTNVNGRSATVLPAGTYYVAMGAYSLTMNSDFSVVRSSTSTITGQMTLRGASNLPAFCNAADVASIGSGVGGGADGQNTVDDVIGYLGEFFANNASVADLITLGGALPAQPDGLVTVDDLIYFLSQFFSPCVP
jgi:hypothetical protein